MALQCLPNTKSTWSKVAFYAFFWCDSNPVTFTFRARKVASNKENLKSKSRAEMPEHVVIWVPLLDVLPFQGSRCKVQFFCS